MDAVSSYAWIAWLVLILIFVIVEMLTLEFTFLMIAVGSVGGLIAGLFGAHWWLQLLVAAVLAVLLLFTIRPPLLRALKRGADPARSNIDAVIGTAGQVVSTVTDTGGEVKLANGESWTAKVAPAVEYRALRPGESVLVVAIDGATAVVTPVERTLS